MQLNSILSLCLFLTLAVGNLAQAAPVQLCRKDAQGRVVLRMQALLESAMSNPRLQVNQDEAGQFFHWMHDLAGRDPSFLNLITQAWCKNGAATISVDQMFVSDVQSNRQYDEEYYSAKNHLVVSGSALSRPSHAIFIRKEMYYKNPQRRDLARAEFFLLGLN